MGLKEDIKQMSMLIPNLEELVPLDHRYRKLQELINWKELTNPLRSLYSKEGRQGYAVERGFKCLLLQFLEDKSDRQMEDFLRDSLAAKYFCNFGLTEATPDHSYFGRFRERIGTYQLSKLFKKLTQGLKEKKLIREIYSFVDASKIVACVDNWKTRDKAIEDAKNKERNDDGGPTMNNKNVSTYSSDPDARYGVKGNNDIWLGYKQHVCVDVCQGLITKVAVTPANVHDGKALRHVCPRQGAVLADKIYSDGTAQMEMKRRGVHSMAIKKNNAKNKNRDQDAFFSALRMPFEGVFSKMSHRARYRGIVKVQFQAFMEALVHNFKRLLVIEAEPIPIS